MMWGYGPGGYGPGWMYGGIGGWLMFVFVVLIVLVLVAVFAPSLRRDWRGERESGPGTSSGLAILEERYAKGELGREEFLEKKRDLALRS